MAQSQYPVTRRGSNNPALWDAWGDWMNRFIGPSFTERFLSTGTVAPVDVCERDNEFVIRMACAGCRPDDIEATVENDIVRIRGKFMDHDMSQSMGGSAMGGQQQGGQSMGGQQTGGQQMRGQQTSGQQSSQTGGPREVCLIRELPAGRFERDITLPTPVNAEQTHASFENGMLTLVCPKTQAAIGHRIQIGQGTGSTSR